MASRASIEKVYENAGNEGVVRLIDPECRTILDVGCGSGDNARLSRQMGHECKFYGITLSAQERRSALSWMDECWVEDIETSSLDCLSGWEFDSLMFSHVLEHVRDPVNVVTKFLPFLKPNGTVLIGLPNVLFWRQRLLFLMGKFEYKSEGLMDETHIRFFTYFTAQNCLPNDKSGLRMMTKVGDGNVPQWFLRSHLFPTPLSVWVDRMGCKLFPNLFGFQILITARKLPPDEG